MCLSNTDNSIIYFNSLTQQLQEPIAGSAQKDKYKEQKIKKKQAKTKLN